MSDHGLIPRTPGRPREFDMDEALDKAVRVFCIKGFHATSVGDLADAMELTTGSIYKAFADKRAVFLAALDRYTAGRNAQLEARLECGSTGLEKLRGALMFFVGFSHGAEGRQGCLVINTAAELATFDADIQARVLATLQKREKQFAELIRLGQKDGSIAMAINVKAAARFALCFLQGLRVIGKTSPAEAEMKAAVDVALRAFLQEPLDP